MKLVILGSGTSVPHPQRASAANWLETERGSVLLDVSADSGHRMAEEHLDWPNLDVIWVSHFHLDHMGGLTPFLFSTKWAPQTRKRTKPLRIFGPTGLRKLFDAINDSNNYSLNEQPFPVELIEVNAGKTFPILPDVSATTFSTPHTNESQAIRITDRNGVSMVYTSDTGYSDKLAEFAQGVDVLLMESSFWKSSPVEIHLALEDALRVARLAEPETLILNHLYPEWDGVDLVTEAAALWQGKVIAAEDGLRIEF
ncbi:MAG TPA: MBL fold metallo-hydrolase [Pyrinomonadaceae bacterium]|nr:MBL fold metallo-hydrolase [Pyrinomonadaceae bacterium]